MEARLRVRLHDATLKGPRRPPSFFPYLASLPFLAKWAALIFAATAIVIVAYFTYIQITDYLHRC